MSINVNAIIIYTLVANEAEQILKHAEHVLRHNWNLEGFKRIGSGYEVVTTDGFGNPYSHERELRLFGIAIEVPESMDYRMAMTYLDYGNRKVDCYVEYHFTELD